MVDTTITSSILDILESIDKSSKYYALLSKLTVTSRYTTPDDHKVIFAVRDAIKEMLGGESEDDAIDGQLSNLKSDKQVKNYLKYFELNHIGSN